MFKKQCFLMSFNLHSTSKNSFHSNLMKISEHFNLSNLNPDLLDTANIKHIINLIEQEYVSYLNCLCFVLCSGLNLN